MKVVILLAALLSGCTYVTVTMHESEVPISLQMCLSTGD